MCAISVRSRFISLLVDSLMLQWTPPFPSATVISAGPLVTPASLFSSSLKRKEYLRLGVTYSSLISGQQQAGIMPDCVYLLENVNNFVCFAAIEKNIDLFLYIKHGFLAL